MIKKLKLKQLYTLIFSIYSKNIKMHDNSYNDKIKVLYRETKPLYFTPINEKDRQEIRDTYEDLCNSLENKSIARPLTNISFPEIIRFPASNFGLSNFMQFNGPPIYINNVRYNIPQLDWSLIFNTLLNQFTENGDQPVPLDASVVNNFKEVPFNELQNHTKIEITDNCSICCSNFTSENNDELSALVIPCGHYFHKPCITEWLTKYHYKCPLCRKSCKP